MATSPNVNDCLSKKPTKDKNNLQNLKCDNQLVADEVAVYNNYGSSNLCKCGAFVPTSTNNCTTVSPKMSSAKPKNMGSSMCNECNPQESSYTKDHESSVCLPCDDHKPKQTARSSGPSERAIPTTTEACTNCCRPESDKQVFKERTIDCPIKKPSNDNKCKCAQKLTLEIEPCSCDLNSTSSLPTMNPNPSPGPCKCQEPSDWHQQTTIKCSDQQTKNFPPSKDACSCRMESFSSPDVSRQPKNNENQACQCQLQQEVSPPSTCGCGNNDAKRKQIKCVSPPPPRMCLCKQVRGGLFCVPAFPNTSNKKDVETNKIKCSCAGTNTTDLGKYQERDSKKCSIKPSIDNLEQTSNTRPAQKVSKVANKTTNEKKPIPIQYVSCVNNTGSCLDCNTNVKNNWNIIASNFANSGRYLGLRGGSPAKCTCPPGKCKETCTKLKESAEPSAEPSATEAGPPCGCPSAECKRKAQEAASEAAADENAGQDEANKCSCPEDVPCKPKCQERKEARIAAAKAEEPAPDPDVATDPPQCACTKVKCPTNNPPPSFPETCFCNQEECHPSCKDPALKTEKHPGCGGQDTACDDETCTMKDPCICPGEICEEPPEDPCICPPTECEEDASKTPSCVCAPEECAAPEEPAPEPEGEQCADKDGACDDETLKPGEQGVLIAVDEEGKPMMVEGANQKIVAYMKDKTAIVLPALGCAADPTLECCQPKGCLEDSTLTCNTDEEGCMDNPEKSCNDDEEVKEPGIVCKCTDGKCVKADCEAKKKALLTEICTKPSEDDAAKSKCQCVGPCNPKCEKVKNELNTAVIGANENPRDSGTQIEPEFKPAPCTCATTNCNKKAN